MTALSVLKRRVGGKFRKRREILEVCERLTNHILRSVRECSNVAP
jgi:hypothetical protein